MGTQIKTDKGDVVEVETIDHQTNEGLDELMLELDTAYGYSLIYLNEEKAKALRDLLTEWCDG